MALPAPLQALFDRLQAYNNGPYNAQSNPLGLARGGNQNPVANFLSSLKDFSAFGKGISDNVDGSVDAAAASASAAAADRVQTGQDRTATTQDREAAAASAVESANQAQKLAGTSTTSVTPGTGARTFTTQAGKYFAVGTFLTIVSTAAPTTRWMAGQVTAYNATTGALTVNVEAIGATTSAAASWNIYLGGPRGAQGVQGIPGIATMPYLSRSANTQLVAGDSASLIDATGTFTQTFAVPSTLGANWYCFYKNAGTGQITIPASDGRTNWIMYPGEMRLFQCDGATLRSEVLHPFSVTFVASGSFILPPGYSLIEGLIWGGGGGGASGQNVFGGGGGACCPVSVSPASLALSTPVTIGSGGAPQTGGGTSTFASFSAYGGGAGTGDGGGGGGGIYSSGAPGNSNFTAGGSPSSPRINDVADRLNHPFGGAHYGSSGTYAAASYGGGAGYQNSSANVLHMTSVFGGAGGGRDVARSVFGGSGGGIGIPPQAPGGGGGPSNSATSPATPATAGARGELRLWGVV